MSNANDLNTSYKGQVLAAKSIPTLPIALQKITALIDGNRTNLAKVAELITQDQSLSAKVLKLVNSPVYGFPRRIVSIHNALILLGVNAVHGLLISTVVFEIVSKQMRGLWDHSLACSSACKVMARHFKIKEEEEFILSGLLHDFGKVIISIQLPDAMRDILSLVANEDTTTLEAEKLILGFDHTRVNSWVAQHWNLPLGITAAMTFHHDPMKAGNHKTLASVVHLGDFFTRVFEMGNAGDTNVSEISPMVLKHLNLDQNDLRELVDKIGIEFQKQTQFPVFGR